MIDNRLRELTYLGDRDVEVTPLGMDDRDGSRVYRRSQSQLTWEQVVISLQYLMDLPLTVGGRTALEELGYAHYLSAQMREVHTGIASRTDVEILDGVAEGETVVDGPYRTLARELQDGPRVNAQKKDEKGDAKDGEAKAVQTSSR